MPKYSVTGNCVTTSGGSTTLPLGNLVRGSGRVWLNALNLGSAASPADNAWKFQLQMGTTAGTWGGSGGAALTPQKLDQADRAANTTANQGICSVGPTLTSNFFVWQEAINQRASIIWQAYPGFEPIIPDSSNNSMNLLAASGSSVANEIDFNFTFTE